MRRTLLTIPVSTPVADYSGNYQSLPVRMLNLPADAREGRRSLPVTIAWLEDTQPPRFLLHVNVSMQQVSPLSQICAVYVDNTACSQDVSLLWPDTQFRIVAPSGSQGYYPVTTASLELYVWLPDGSPVAGDQTILQVLNFLPPPGVLMSKFELTGQPPVPPQPSESLPSTWRYRGLWRISGVELPGQQSPYNVPLDNLPAAGAVPFTWAAWAPGTSAFYAMRPGTGAVAPIRPSGTWLIGVYIYDNGDNQPANWQGIGLFDFTNYPSAAYRGNTLWYARPLGDQNSNLTSQFLYFNHQPGEAMWLVIQCQTSPSQPASDMFFGVNATILDYPLATALRREGSSAVPPLGPLNLGVK